MTHTGKIARLPHDIRNELNRRIQDGEPGCQLVDWLNAMPETQALLQRWFKGRPINEPNLTDWKQGGYLEWLTQQDSLARAVELAANATELNDAAPGLMSDHLATVLVARYADELADWNGEATDEFRRKLRILRDFCHDVVELRRGDHDAATLKMEQQLLDRDQEQPDEYLLKRFLHWIEFPKVRESILDQDDPEARSERLKTLLGITPDTPAEPEKSGTSGEVGGLTL